MAGIAVAEHRLAAMVDELADHEVQLQVGIASPGWLLMKPPASAKLVVSMPLRSLAPLEDALAARCTAPASEMPNRSCQVGRVAPPAPRRRGRADAGPRRAGRGRRRCRVRQQLLRAGPMPDSIRICGDCRAPAHSSTSRAALSCWVSPSCTILDAHARACPPSGCGWCARR